MSGENVEEIKIIAEDLTAAGVSSAKKNLEGLGKASETARLGFWGLGEAAENAAQSMGAPSQLSRQLGNSVEGLASKLGGAALAFGLVGFAAMAGVGIYNHFAEAQKKATEETIKAGIAAGNWIEAAMKDQAQTDELTTAKGRLRQAEFDLNKQRAEAAIPALLQKIKDKQKELNDEMEIASGKITPFYYRTQDGENIFEASARKANKLKLEVAEIAGQLGVARAQAQMFGEANRNAMGGDGSKSQAAYTEYEFSQMLMYQAGEEERIFEEEMQAWRKKNSEDRQMWDYQEWETRNALAFQGTQAQIKEEERLALFKQQTITSTVSFLTQSLQTMYNAGGSHARRNFSLYKSAAVVEAIINADVAAGGAYRALAWIPGVGPTLGAAAAGVAYAAGWARVQSIRKQTFDGGGSGGGGGAPVTYGGSSAIVPASSSGGGAMNLTLNVNGQTQGIYEITKGVLRTIYNNGGGVDGLSASVELSA